MKSLPQPDENGEYTDKQKERIRKYVKNSTMWHLNRMDQTVSMIRTRLTKKHVPSEFIDEIIDYVIQEGYVDEKRYADDFVYSKRTYSKIGEASIRVKLRQKGINDEVITQALEDYQEKYAESSYEDDAYELALKKYNQTLGKTTPEKQKQRIIRQLLYKGYSYDIVSKAIQRVLDEQEE
jgi:regulatory protein